MTLKPLKKRSKGWVPNQQDVIDNIIGTREENEIAIVSILISMKPISYAAGHIYAYDRKKDVFYVRAREATMAQFLGLDKSPLGAVKDIEIKGGAVRGQIKVKRAADKIKDAKKTA